MMMHPFAISRPDLRTNNLANRLSCVKVEAVSLNSKWREREKKVLFFIPFKERHGA